MLNRRPSIGYLRSLCLAAALSTGGLQAGEYYKWVDDKGITHFSEKPVPGSSAKKVGTATKYSDTPSDEATAKPEAGTAAEGEKPAENTQNAENCKIAQDHMKSLNSGQRIRLVDKDGKFTYLSEDQIKEEVTKTQAVIKASCG